jgi:hypothetical protein
MANQKHLDILKQGKDVWNKWRKDYPEKDVDLSEANLERAYLNSIDFTRTNLDGANLSKTSLNWAIFSYASLRGANLARAELYKANFEGAVLNKTDLNSSFLGDAVFLEASLTDANLREAYLNGANLRSAYLNGADLSEADLSMVNLCYAHLERAILARCRVYGIVTCNDELREAIQSDLIATPMWEPTIYVDIVEDARLIYSLLNSENIREIAVPLTSKIVLILSNYISERVGVLNALKDELRKCNYIPVLFDLREPATRNIVEKLPIIARMAQFVIADLTNDKSIPEVLQAITPYLSSVPVQLLLQNSQRLSSVFEDLYRYSWVLPAYQYQNTNDLLESFQEHIIEVAEQKAKELAKQ